MQTDKTLRVRHENTPEQFAAVVQAITAVGGNIISAATHHVGRHHIYRDITVSVRTEADVEALLTVVKLLPGVSVETVIDEVLRMHEGGKLVHVGRVPIRTQAEMREVYTPGVAKVCRAIQHDPGLARRYTNAGNTVAVISNGSRVLGLGDIGPLASLPVMEAKAMFYGQLVDLNAVPIVLDVAGVDEFVETVVRLAPGFAGIHLEDIRSPDCIEIERRLIERLPIPVMHDDQHGTAVVALAAANNLLRAAARAPAEMVFAQVGLGAAGLAVASLAQAAGFRRVIGYDPGDDACRAAARRGIQPVTFEDCLSNGDVLCLTTGRPGLLKPSMVRRGQIILALSNPLPEIEPVDALKAGASGALDGRTVNNLLGYPGLFKGAISSGARGVSVPMRLRAASVIAQCAEGDDVLPDPLSRKVHESVARAVASVASDPHSTLAAGGAFADDA
ncbi:MAG: NAD-dependent malic enzyme [Phycisphaerae bacterium]|nr:NAD-dependent malic enzyme [Phycisphaerae bacterium]